MGESVISQREITPKNFTIFFVKELWVNSKNKISNAVGIAYHGFWNHQEEQISTKRSLIRSLVFPASKTPFIVIIIRGILANKISWNKTFLCMSSQKYGDPRRTKGKMYDIGLLLEKEKNNFCQPIKNTTKYSQKNTESAYDQKTQCNPLNKSAYGSWFRIANQVAGPGSHRWFVMPYQDEKMYSSRNWFGILSHPIHKFHQIATNQATKRNTITMMYVYFIRH